MVDIINKNEGVIGLLGLASSVIFYSIEKKLLAIFIFGSIFLIFTVLIYYRKTKKSIFKDVQNIAKILFIDDKECQIVINLKRNNFDVKKIDDSLYPATDKEVQWANIIFVDYKDVGYKLFGKKEGLGLIKELKRIYGNKKRYVIYSTVQDFDGLVEFPYIRKNATYDEYISLITTEVSKL